MLRTLAVRSLVVLSLCSMWTESSAAKIKTNHLTEPVRCSVWDMQFALSSADGKPYQVAWDKISVNENLHVSVLAEVPDVSTLKIRYYLLNRKDNGSTFPVQRLPNGRFEYVIKHEVLDSNHAYMISIADNFDKPLCVASYSIRTIP